MKKRALLRSVPLIAMGVFLGHGAQAYTVLDFENRPTNQNITSPFGDNAGSSSDGVTVVGFGTPNITLSWEASSGANWQYYNDPVWSAAQLDNSTVGSSFTLGFVPTSSAARVVIKSLNFHPYYDSKERFTFNVSLLAGTNVVSGPTNITFLSDATKNHPVNFNYTGGTGQTLKLRLERLASTLAAGELEGDPYDIAVDDIAFGQLPEQVLTVGPQVTSVTPADGTTGVAGVSYSYHASITDAETQVATNSIQLRFDGGVVSPPASVSSAGGITEVQYQATNLLASGSAHQYALTYKDSAGSSFTNETQFTVAKYATLPAAYADPVGAGARRGFTYRTVAAPQDTTNTLDSTVARAKAQLNGTLVDPSTGRPYLNAATPGTNSDGSFTIDGVLNFSDGPVDAGHFPGDQQFPGLDSPPYDWFATEALLHLDLPAGYYRLDVNSDDGFEFNALPREGVSGPPIQLGIYDSGRGVGDTPFDFLVQTPGVYPFQLIYFESTGSASCELFSTNPITGDMTLINDAADTKAIKSYSALKLRITSIVRSGTDVTVQWASGTPPFQTQFTSNLLSTAWANVGSATTNRTAIIPIGPGSGFIRVYGQ